MHIISTVFTYISTIMTDRCETWKLKWHVIGMYCGFIRYWWSRSHLWYVRNVQVLAFLPEFPANIQVWIRLFELDRFELVDLVKFERLNSHSLMTLLITNSTILAQFTAFGVLSSRNFSLLLFKVKNIMEFFHFWGHFLFGWLCLGKASK